MSQRSAQMLNDSDSHGRVNETTGKELQLYVGQGSHHRIRLDQSVHRTLSQELKEIISIKSTFLQNPSLQIRHQEEQLRFPQGPAMAVEPLSFFKPGGDAFHIRPDGVMTSELRVSRRRTCTVVGELRTSFLIPENSAINSFDIDKIERPDGLEEMSGTDPDEPYQFCFAERLDDWIIERSRRVSGVGDTTYFHVKSNSLFRSTKEVCNFILYEVHPRSRNARRKRKITPEDYGLNEAPAVYSAPALSSAPALHSGSRKCTATEESAVSEFLGRSLKNMLRMNYHRSSFCSTGNSGNETSKVETA